MSGFYCEIDKDGFCYHITQQELPISEKCVFSDKNVLGMVYDSETETFSEYIQPEPEPQPTPEPTQLDRIEAAVTAKNEEIAQAAIDNYTLELMEGGLL